MAAARNRRQASKVIDAVIEYARRLIAGGPWEPPVKPADNAAAPSRPAARTRRPAPPSAAAVAPGHAPQPVRVKI